MTITKRNGKYYCRFQINGERHHKLCTGATTLKEAQSIENAFKYKLQQMQNGVIARENKKRYKLKHLKESFLTYSKINRAVYKQDIGRMNIIFQFFNEETYADSITRKNVEEFKTWLLDKGRTKKTINLYIGILRIAYNLAIKDKWVIENPFVSSVEFKHIEPKKRQYLAAEAQEHLNNAVPDFFMPVIITALNAGIRRDNIINLKWEYLDFNFRMIEITKNKGNKHIKIPMNNTLYNLFISMERVSEYVFINPKTGTKWGTTAFNKLWRQIREKAGLPDLKFHGLRHTVATRLVKEGIPLPVVKELLAHSDIKTTMQYNHIDSLDMINAINVLNSYN
jgi:integrase